MPIMPDNIRRAADEPVIANKMATNAATAPITKNAMSCLPVLDRTRNIGREWLDPDQA